MLRVFFLRWFDRICPLFTVNFASLVVPIVEWLPDTSYPMLSIVADGLLLNFVLLVLELALEEFLYLNVFCEDTLAVFLLSSILL